MGKVERKLYGSLDCNLSGDLKKLNRGGIGSNGRKRMSFLAKIYGESVVVFF